MSIFNRGERIRIMDSGKRSEKVYIIKDMIKCRKGGTLYLLKSLEEHSKLRLYHVFNSSLLERVC